MRKYLFLSVIVFSLAISSCDTNPDSFNNTASTSPTVVTDSVTNITNNSAMGGGRVTFSGLTKVSARGICWSTASQPTLDNYFTTEGSGMGSFGSAMFGLLQGTTYYVRAYATNSAGTSYGNEVTFTTTGIATIVAPTLTTTAISNITATSADIGGNISSDGGAAVTARGVCWSTTTGPTTADSKTTDGTGVGSYPSSMTGLTTHTTYYVRAYATNIAGTAYGNEVSFTTN